MTLVLAEGAEPIAGYRLVKVLGQGGFGQVWLAEAPGEVQVALKFIRIDTGQAGNELRAIKLIRTIRHPHLLEMHFVKQQDEFLIIATSLCDQSLWDRYRECERAGLKGIPIEELLRYMEETATAVDFLNEPRSGMEGAEHVGIQHRDIKPHNIFLVGGSVKVADFGLAKVLASNAASHTGAMTPGYAPPEMFNRIVAKSSDQYSLACTYYELRTGRLPFEGNIADITKGHLFDEPSLESLPVGERPVVARALAKDPAARWATCREFVAAIKSVMPTAKLSKVVLETAPWTPHAIPAPKPADEPRGEVGGIGPNAQVDDQLNRQPQTWHETQSPRTKSRPALLVAIGIGAALLLAAAVAVYVVTGQGALESEFRHSRASESRAADQPFPPMPPPLVAAPFSAGEAKAAQERWAEHLKTSVVVENSIGMKLVLIPPGEFLMGSGESAEETARLARSIGFDDAKAETYGLEHPQHRVHIGKPFAFGMHEVTVAQFRRFVNDRGYKTDAERHGNGSYGWNEVEGEFEGRDPNCIWTNAGFNQDEDHPVVHVTHNDAVEFCRWLSATEDASYRLPTEAEWEYACRAGTTTRYHQGDNADGIASVGNVADGTARMKYPKWTTINAKDGFVFTSPVGSFRSNSFGLFDMHGNVCEWCADFYGEGYYAESPAVDPSGPSSGELRMLRGGAWNSSPIPARAASRFKDTRDLSNGIIGFRVVRTYD